MNKINIALVFVFLNLTFYGKTIKVSSPGTDNDIQPALQSAINSALKGDIVELPAGQFVINKFVSITKFVSIVGQGIGKTILYRAESVDDATLNSNNWRTIFRYTINSNESSRIIIADITFKSKKPSMVEGDGLSRASDIGIELVRCVDFVITRCRFENFGNGAVSIIHDDSIVGGLIFKNQFYHNVKGYDGLGLGYGVVVYGINKKWLTNPKFGSSNFIFVENNEFEYHRHSIAGGGAALYVFRYNNVKNNTAANSSHAIDAHEARLEAGGNYYSSRGIEVYNNNIVNSMFRDGTSKIPNGTVITAGKSVDLLTEAAICTRGGEAIIHHNYIEGYRFGVGLVADGQLKIAYPIPYQQGYLSGVKYGINHTGSDSEKGNGDVFIWSDNFKFYDSKNKQNSYFYNYTPVDIKEERDYHMSAKPNYTPYVYPHPLSLIVVTSTDEGYNSEKNDFLIYPNPTIGGKINISKEHPESGTIELFNISGELLKNTQLLSTTTTTIDLNDVSPGMYFLRITSPTTTFTNKISVVH